MAGLVRGDVVVVPFPFSNLSTAKRRPALVLASLQGDDVLLCQITSQTTRDDYAVALTEQDFTEGTLRKPSNVRPNRLFTADKGIVLYRVGRISPTKTEEAIRRIVQILTAP
jgi:mRNA interferase MazF